MPQLSHIDPGPDTFRILLTTDNHVGFKEDDKIRGDDGWKTFEEIMHVGLERDVDMIVQGGDLFHVNKPTKKSYYHVMRLLRECCWNDKPIEFKLISDPTDAMATRHFAYPSEYDTNINVGMPMYAISGNHDDATGDELLSPLDLLGVSGLMNHFGRVTNNDNIVIHPLLFNKGTTNLALYGLQSVREERLMKTMVQGNLEFLKPDTDESYQWFNLMCIHQNHVPRPGVKVVEETALPDFLDFVLWGHEHECFTSTHFNHTTNTDILLPGSSIATSLSEGEVPDKHVFILSVKGKDFSLEPIKLKSVRPFAMKEVILKETGLNAGTANKGDVLSFLLDEVDKLIEDARGLWKFNNKERYDNGDYTDADIPLPLVRLRVDYTGGYEVENPRFFSNRFVGKVANVNDVVLFFKKKIDSHSLTLERKNRLNAKKSSIDEEVNMDDEPEGNRDIVDMINEGLNDNDLILLRKEGYTQIVDDLITREDKALLSSFVKEEEEKDLELLLELNINDDGHSDEVTIKKDTSATITSIKKNFRHLAKQIRAESIYSENSRSSTAGLASASSSSAAAKTTTTTINKRAGKKSKISESVVLESDSDKDEDLSAMNYFASAQAKLAATTTSTATNTPPARRTPKTTTTRKSTIARGRGKNKVMDPISSDSDNIVITSGSDQEVIELEDDEWDASKKTRTLGKSNSKPKPTPAPKKKASSSKKNEVQSQLSDRLFSNLGRRR